jgi:hypothetical protein
MSCPELQLCGVSATAVGSVQIRINGEAKLVATAKNPGTSGDCCRTGSVEFYWEQAGTTNEVPANGPPPTPTISSSAPVLNNVGTNNDVLCPGDHGTATLPWVPEPSVIGNISVPTVGNIFASISCNDDIIGSCVCDPVGQNPNDPYTKKSQSVIVFPAVAMYEEFKRLRQETTRSDQFATLYLGFGIRGDGQNSKLVVRALEGVNYEAFTVPDLAVGVFQSKNPPHAYGHHAGVIVPGYHVHGADEFAPEVEFKVRKGDQGVVRIRWPNDSEGKPTLFAIWQEINGRRVGGLTLGLRNVPIDSAGFVWL